ADIASITGRASPPMEARLDAAETGDIDPTPFIVRKNGAARLELAVDGAKCAGCIRKIEGAMTALPGMDHARLNLSTGRLTLAWQDGALAPAEIVQALKGTGYAATPFDPKKANAAHDEEGRRLLTALGVAGFAAANVMLLSVSVWAGGGDMAEGTRGLMHWASAMIAIPCALYAGRPFFSSAWRALRAGHANMDVPISLAVILALTVSTAEFFAGGEHAYFDAAVMLLFFLLIGRYLDHRLRWRARAAARGVLALQSNTATLVSDTGAVIAVAAGDVQPGDRLLLAPGDRAPVDGIVAEGRSHVDAALVTGESAPQLLSVNDRIHAGVVNQSARLIMRATATAADSLVAELARLVEAGEQSRSRYVKMADKAAALYVPVVHSLALATFILWALLPDAGLRTAIMNAVAVLIITCPCALGLAAPAVQIVATGRLFKRGVLVKSGDALERLAEADVVVFDKTGTLTLGRPILTNAGAIAPETLWAAASLARLSRHPLSRAIAALTPEGPVAETAEEFPGLGVEGEIDGRRARLGAAEWVGAAPTTSLALETWFKIGDDAPVLFQFEDAPREDAADAVRLLKDRGLRLELLSGDRADVAEAMARRLGIDEWRANVSPADKAARLSALRDAGCKVAMIGDGLNDAPSLAGAHVALSPGAAADATQAAADFVYLGDRLAPIVDAIAVSESARARMRQNFFFAAAYNACAIPLAVSGAVTPLIAALAMSGSSLVVTLNALRANKRRESRLRLI
ncbi:MAG: heavy metal translocating P-type ATPase, partial [Pseudomonadota bacterium]